jgi:hypothetical protein
LGGKQLNEFGDVVVDPTASTTDQNARHAASFIKKIVIKKFF